ncbi:MULTISPECIES: hypothetical protein [unclassified Nonomuraea]|uniref:hypothetical protein n=1 Tax=unclassified Nonomuraea TaxID=2593643 RepID=UPI0033D6152F
MTGLDQPDATDVFDVDLVLDRRLGGIAADPRLAGRVSIGAPYVRKLTADTPELDSAARAFIAEHQDRYDFHWLAIVCTFREGTAGAPFTKAAVGMRFESPDAAPAEQPIAWSLAPKLQAYPRRARDWRVTLTANLSFVESSVEYAPGPPPQDVFLAGYGERDPDPEWRLEAVAGQPLAGDQPLTVTIRAAAGRPVTADIRVTATIRHHRLGLIPYRAELPAALETIPIST